MLLKNINHIAIIVSDLNASYDFYVNKLGFRVIQRVDRPERQSSILYLDASNCIIELFSFPNPPNAYPTPKPVV